MKSQVKSSPYRSCFAASASARFSPTSVTPASASTGRSAASTYFVAASTSTPGPTSSRTWASRSRTTRGSITCAHHALPPGDATVPPVREEALGRADRALLRDVDPLDAASLQCPACAQPEIGTAVVHHVLAEPCSKRPGHVLPHLVATRAGARPDRGPRAGADGRDPRLCDARLEAPPAGGQQRQPRAPPSRRAATPAVSRPAPRWRSAGSRRSAAPSAGRRGT